LQITNGRTETPNVELVIIDIIYEAGELVI
jgi:hypothetical protein